MQHYRCLFATLFLRDFHQTNHIAHISELLHRERKKFTEFRDRNGLINRNEVAAADIEPRQIVSGRGSIRRRCEGCVQAEGGHFEHLL
jgi:hypothetical protein